MIEAYPWIAALLTFYLICKGIGVVVATLIKEAVRSLNDYKSIQKTERQV